MPVVYSTRFTATDRQIDRLNIYSLLNSFKTTQKHKTSVCNTTKGVHYIVFLCFKKTKKQTGF